MKDLQKRILKDEAIRKVEDVQCPDGWLGTRFHTAEIGSNYGAAEVAIRLLCEKGASRQHPLLARALKALRGTDETFAREFIHVGKTLDSKGFGGSYLIRASLFARAGVETETFVQEQVSKALAAFRAVPSARSFSDITTRVRRKLVFRSGVVWPSIYHLRLLAFTFGWRTTGNIDMMAKSIRHISTLSAFPTVYVQAGSQLVAPCRILTNSFACDRSSLSLRYSMRWFEELELLSRLGVIEKIPELRTQCGRLLRHLQLNNGRFLRPVRTTDFTKWSAYTGLALENDWRSKKRRVSDLTFRSLLILIYSKFSN